MCGPVSGSLQFRSVARHCTPPFAYESGSEERAERPRESVYVAMIRGGREGGQTIARNYANPGCSCAMS